MQERIDKLKAKLFARIEEIVMSETPMSVDDISSCVSLASWFEANERIKQDKRNKKSIGDFTLVNNNAIEIGEVDYD